MNKAPTFLEVLKWSDDQCRDYLEAKRWPNGPECPACGATEPYRIERKTRTKNKVQRLFKCRDCRRQFTVTVGTIFEDSKIPLSKWFAAINLMCSSKKGISAHQLFRMLEIGSYRSAWYMAHRIREAMADKVQAKIKGTVEADVTFVGGKSRRHHPVAYHERIQDDIRLGIRRKDGTLKGGPTAGKPHPRTAKAPVLGMLERGGKVRTIALKENDEQAREIRPLLREHLDPSVHLLTDAHSAYKAIKDFVRHDAVKHEVEYVNYEHPEIHTQNIEGYWSLLKRSVIGTFHHIHRGYLPMYLSELEYKFNSRDVSDPERFEALLGQTEGRLRWFGQS